MLMVLISVLKDCLYLQILEETACIDGSFLENVIITVQLKPCMCP